MNDAHGGTRAGERASRWRDATQRHSLEVLEYDKVRETIASYAASAVGKSLVMSMLPLGDAESVRQALRETEEMRALLRHARMPLAGLRDVVSEVERLADQGLAGEPDFFYRVLDLLRTALSVRTLLEENSSALPDLARLAEGLADLPELRDEIPARIDPREGVRDDATPKLAGLRRDVAELRQELRAKAHRILSSVSLARAFQGEGVTLKYDRYLLPVKAEYRSWVKGPIRDRSQSGATLYVEPEELTAGGDRLLAALDRERDEVQRVLRELTRRILDARPVLRRIQRGLGRIDFTFAKASYAEAFACRAPEINTSGRLDLRGARHPHLLWLARDTRRDHRAIDLERVQSSVVPVSVRLGDDFRVLIITGPNTGGKTVALKTVGLNVLLAMSGVPVPVDEGSNVPLYSSVFADIGDEQSLEQSLSTFSSHLKHLIEILRAADDRSLVLLDELGAGTDPVEGAALGRALLDRFLERGWNAIITTHISSLKEYAYNHDGAENAAMEFDSGNLAPTYRLLLGVPGSSHALAIACRMGLDEEVLAAAEKEVARVEEPTREIISRMERSRRRVEKERRRVERVRRRAQGTAREYDERLRALDAEREAVDLEAQLELDRLAREARERLRELVGQLKNLPQSHQSIVEKLSGEVDELVASMPLGEKRDAFARALKKGDEVYVPKFREKATVRKTDKTNRVLTVLLGGVPVEIGFDDVSWLENPPSTHEKA